MTIFEVGPRDGLQAESVTLSVDDRLEYIRRLALCGLTDIEVGSFVRSEWVPQMAGTLEICAQLKKWPKNLRSKFRAWAFVPNMHGLEQALEASVDGVGFFIAASETFCKKNVNRSTADILLALQPMLALCKKKKLRSRVYLSTAFYCPYEGTIAATTVSKLAKAVLKLGAQEIVLSDTTGHAVPSSVQKLLRSCDKQKIPQKFLSLHLHDTRGAALANALMGHLCGIRKFDSSSGGIGGCPYAPGATGNLATEDLANLFLGMGHLSGVDLHALASASLFAGKCLGKSLPSKVLKTLT